MAPEVWITGSNGKFMPETVDEVSWTTELFGAGVLEFKVIKEGSISFKEGDKVEMSFDGNSLFCGRVFEKKRTQLGVISVVAYDLMRYLRNKDSYTFINKTATQIVSMICSDYKLTTGNIAQTGFVIPSRIEDNSTLFDMIYTALSLTKNATGNEFLLYDDLGKISLQPISYFDTNLLVDNETSIGFDYSTTIDREVYNKVKLIHTTSQNKVVTDTVYADSDSAKIDEWGVLQYFRHIDGNIDGNLLVKNILNTYDRKNRKLVVTTVGNRYMRAGCSVYVNLDIGDFLLDEKMRVKKCVHTFSDNQHFAALTLSGGQLDTK